MHREPIGDNNVSYPSARPSPGPYPDLTVAHTHCARADYNVRMKVILDLCVVPLGVGVSVSPYIAACPKVLREAGLEHQMHAYGTNIEGEWDAVFAAVKKCHEVVHAMGAPRITTSIKVGTRVDREQTMQDKIDSVKAKM